MASPTTEETSHLSLDHFSCSTVPSSAPNELTASSTKGKDSKLCAIRAYPWIRPQNRHELYPGLLAYTPGEWPLATSPVSMTSTSRLSRALGLPTAVKTLHIHDATDYGEASPLSLADFS